MAKHIGRQQSQVAKTTRTKQKLSKSKSCRVTHKTQVNEETTTERLAVACVIVPDKSIDTVDAESPVVYNVGWAQNHDILGTVKVYIGLAALPSIL